MANFLRPYIRDLNVHTPTKDPKTPHHPISEVVITYREKKEIVRMKDQDIYLDTVRADFYMYNLHVHNEGVGLERYRPSEFHKRLCRQVQNFIERNTGHPYDILIIETPPQHGKSKSVTETLPSWYLGRNPEKRVIEISYSDDFAKRFGRRNKEKILSYGGLFGIGLSAETKSVTEFELDNRIGGMLSVGVGGRITGNPGNLIIIDDPIKNRQEADSEVYRNRLWEEWNNSIKTRTAPGAKIILIMTRWHEDDFAGRLKAREKDVEVLSYPCEAEGKDWRKKGEALCPEMGKDNSWLKQFKEAFLSGDEDFEGESGQRAWEALFQCRPSSLEGNLLKREWWRRHDGCQGVKFDRLVISCDPAFKDKESNDFVAIQVWGRLDNPTTHNSQEYGAGFYLMKIIKEHLNFKATVDTLLGLSMEYPQAAVLVEDKANGSAVIEMLRTKIWGVIAILPESDKVSRVNAISYLIESGSCYVPKKCSDFINECSSFPRGKHDDQVDCMSQALNHLRQGGKRRKTRRKKERLPCEGDIIEVI